MKEQNIENKSFITIKPEEYRDYISQAEEKAMIDKLIDCGFSADKLKIKGLDYFVKNNGSNLSLGEK